MRSLVRVALHTKQTSTILYASLAMLFISLFVHEGASVLLAALFLMSTFGNYYLLQQTKQSVYGFFRVTNHRHLLFGAMTVTLLYFSLYFGWRMAFPSAYDGNALGSLNIEKVLPVLWSLATSGSILSDIFSAYSVTFSDAVSQDGFRVTYSVLSYLGSSLGGLLAWLCALIVLLVVFTLLMASKNHQEANFGKNQINVLAGFVTGGLITILPILPVAFVGKYQLHYYELGVHSYCDTALSHFGATLSLASTVIWFCDLFRDGSFFKNAVSGFVAVSIAVLALCGYRMNDEIASDISVETNRRRAVNQSMALTSLLNPEIHAIYAPRLQSGSWFTVVDQNYWSEYVSTFFNKSLLFYSNVLPEIGRGAAKVAYMDFMLGRDGSQVIVLMAPLAKAGASDAILVDRIMVSIEKPSPSDFNQFVLSFKDKLRGSIDPLFTA